MKSLEQKLMDCKKYTRYQVKQIMYLVKTLSSDISKVIIMGILFHQQLPAYLTALVVLFLLRSYSGGMHFHTYPGCLITSILYFVLSIFVLPYIHVDFVLRILLLTACMILCDRIGPITSKYRPKLSEPKIMICRNITTCIIFLFIIILYIIPENPYVIVGFWVVILHTLQLIIARLLICMKQRRKEDESC